jgi:hypothetical protein
MIRVYFSLFLIGLAGMGLLIAPPQLLQFEGGDPARLFKIWQASLESFAIPLSLCLLGFTRHPLVRFGSCFWGGWIALFSFLVLIKKHAEIPLVNFYGVLFIVFIIILSITAILSSMMFFFNSPGTTPTPEKSGNRLQNPLRLNKPL